MKKSGHWKQFIAIITLLFIIFTTGIQSSFATSPASAKDLKFLTSPKEDLMATTSSTLVFAGKGAEGDLVTISVYLKNKTKYSLEDEITFKIESLGAFVKEVELYPGENKIEVSLNHKGSEASEVRTIKYSPKNNINMEKLIKDLNIKKMPKK